MLVIILNPRFKNMKVVHEFVGNDAMPQGIMKENDQNIILLLLLQVYSHFNIMSAPILEHVTNLDEDDFMGNKILMNVDAIYFILKNELQLSHCWHVNLKECENPLKWWA